MKLFFIGCSHTFGDDLDDPATQSWPALVAKELNCEFTNASISGGTNERTLYHTVKNLFGYDKFYIAWTYIQRFTRYRPDNNFEINFNPALSHHLYGQDPAYVDYGRMHYTHWYNELFAFKLWTQQIILLQSFLEKNHKPYVMVNSCPNNIKRWTSSWQEFYDSVQSLLCFDIMDDAQLFQEHQEIQTLVGQIDQKRFLGWNEWCISDLNTRYPSGVTGHLLNQGHQSIADYILDNDKH